MAATFLGRSSRFSRPARSKVAMAALATAGLLGAMALAPGTSQAVAKPTVKKPSHVLIVLFDQMRPEYADRFNMTNFKKLRAGGTNFRDAQLGYMGSETVISHNVIVSGQSPKHMGWVDEVYRDTENLLGNGDDAVHITGDLSLANFETLINNEGYPKLADYLHTKRPGSKFITVGQKSYAVESAAAGTGRHRGADGQSQVQCHRRLCTRKPRWLLQPQRPLARPGRPGGPVVHRHCRPERSDQVWPLLRQLRQGQRLRNARGLPVVDLRGGRQPLLPGL